MITNNNKIFTEQQAITFIEKAFGCKGTLSKKDNVNYSLVCPICKSLKDSSYSKQKLVIRVDNFYIKCWVCGFKARNLIRILKKYRPMFLHEYLETFFTETLQTTIDNYSANNPDGSVLQERLQELPEGFGMLATAQGSSKYLKSHLEYLQARQLGSEEDLWYWKLGFVPWDNKEFRYRVIVPSFDSNGDLNFYTARSVIKTNPNRYKNPSVSREDIVFNEINLDWSKELLIVEGPFDLMKTKKATENATCLLGSELTSNYTLFEKIVMNKTPVVISLDYNKRKNQYQIAERLHEFGNKVRFIDLNKEIEDIGSLSVDQFTDIYQSDTVEYNNDYLLRMKINSLQE